MDTSLSGLFGSLADQAIRSFTDTTIKNKLQAPANANARPTSTFYGNYSNLANAGMVDAYGNPILFLPPKSSEEPIYVEFEDYDPDFVGAGFNAGEDENYGDFSNAGASSGASAGAGASAAAGAAGAGLFKRWGNKLYPATSKLKGIIDPDNYHWTKSGGINFGGTLDEAGKLTGGRNLGGWLTLGHTALDATQVGSNVMDIMNAKDNRDALVRDIAASAGSNPMAEDFLTGDEIQLLNRIRNGTYRGEDNVGKGLASGIGSALTQGGIGVLTGAAGGIPGMVLGGIGGVAKGLSSGVKSQTATDTSKLQSLYSSLRNADAQYKSMRRPSMNGLNMQSRYREMYS